MKTDYLYSVITTIQPPTASVRALGRALRPMNGRLLVVGDRKGPTEYSLKGAELFEIEAQLQLPLRIARLLPLNHYTRKNLGYLIAISRGSGCIYETDDDNRPSPEWRLREPVTRARPITKPGWCNAYRYFTKDLIWPRGLPLDQINPGKVPAPSRVEAVNSSIQQGLADGNPDVDAIWRLVLDKPFRFTKARSLALMPGVWCPFNSQSTWWWPVAFPLMYLPSFCTFRMTDIWRSFVAQRCLWELGGVVTFHAPEVIQERNFHNLLRDFRDEVPGYLGNEQIRKLLENLCLESGEKAVGRNLVSCYEALVQAGVFPRKELPLLRAWLSDLRAISNGLTL